MKRYRIAIITNKGNPKSENFDTLNFAEEWLLKQYDLEEGVKYYRIMDREIGEVIETEKGKIKKHGEI